MIVRFIRLIFFCFLAIRSVGQTVKHSYRFYNTFAVPPSECGPNLTQEKALGNCPAPASPGGFVSDTLPYCKLRRTVYHSNLHWGLKYPNTEGTITNTYTIHMYVKTTNWGNATWARIIDFSDGLSDSGIYFKNTSGSPDRCLDFYPSGIIGACPYFNNSTYYLLTFTRNGQTGVIDVYVNNTLFISYNDAAGRYVGKTGTPIYIFRDDRSVACESGEANFAYLSFTNQYSSQSTVDAVYKDICTIANQEPVADFSITPSPSCANQNVTIAYTGDQLTPDANYTFDWNWDGGTIISGSGAGPYVVQWSTVGVKNITMNIKSTACARPITKTKPVTIGNLSVTATTQKGSCSAPNDGGITLTATNGIAPYQYSLDSIQYQAANTFKVAPRTYTVYVRDANGCRASLPVTVESTNDISLQTLRDTSVCRGRSVKLLTTSNATHFSWTPANGLDNPNSKEPEATVVAKTSYIVTATTGSCSKTDTVTVSLAPDTPAPTAGAVAVCAGEPLPELSAVGTDLRWYTDSTLRVQVGTGPSFKPGLPASQPGIWTYFVTQTAPGGCLSAPAKASITIRPLPELAMSIYTYTVCFSDLPNGLLTLDAGENNGLTYRWSTAAGVVIGSGRSIQVQQAGVYQIQARDSQQCTQTETVTVEEFCSPIFFVPDAFSPNGDGVNDLFEIKGRLPASVTLTVFNRWGEVVFSNAESSWDGTYRSEPCPEGIYLWKLETALPDANNQPQTHIRKGQLLLTR